MGGFLPRQFQKNSAIESSSAISHAPWLIDAAVVFTMWLLVLDLNPFTNRPLREGIVLAAFAAALQLAVAMSRGRYVEVPRPSRTDEVANTILATLVSAASIPLCAQVFNWNSGARELVLGAALVMPALGVSGEVRRSRRRGRKLQPVVIVGTGQEARELAELLTDHPETGMKFVGVVGDRATAERHDLGPMWIGPTERLVSTMEAAGTTKAVVAPSSFRSTSFRTVVNTLLDNNFDIALSSGVSRIGVHRHRVSDVVHEPLVLLEPLSVRGWHAMAKRAADVVGAAIGLVLAAPVLGLAALAIKITDRGPVLYRQDRVGRDGQRFSIIKLRTMRVNADRELESLKAENERNGPLFKLTGDKRITRVGKVLRELSLDELPQLFNVLRGDMSLVGPRPALPSEVEEFDAELRSRAKVRPGLTGLWQVEARTNASFSAYRRLDLHYVDNWSFWLDVRIILATAQLLTVSLALKAVRAVLRRNEPAVDSIEQYAPLATFEAPEPVLDLAEQEEAPALNAAS